MTKGLLVLVAVLGMHANAFAAWEPILTLDAPNHTGTERYFVDTEIFTSRLKVRKEGSDCNRARLNYRAVGRLTSGVEVYLNLIPAGSTADGARVYHVNPAGTIYSLEVQTASFARDCQYTFSAEVVE